MDYVACARCGAPAEMFFPAEFASKYCEPCDQLLAWDEQEFDAWWEQESPHRTNRMRRAYRDVSRTAWMARAEYGRKKAEAA